jgi:hypothetical protein
VSYDQNVDSETRRNIPQTPATTDYFCPLLVLTSELLILVTLAFDLSVLIALSQCGKSLHATTRDAYRKLYGSAVQHRLRGSSNWRDMVLKSAHFTKCSRAQVHRKDPVKAVNQLLGFRTPTAEIDALSEMLIAVHRETDGSCLDVLEALATACLAQGQPDEAAQLYSEFLNVQCPMTHQDWESWVLERCRYGLTTESEAFSQDSLPSRIWLAFTLFLHIVPSIVSRRLPDIEVCGYLLSSYIARAAASRGDVKKIDQLQRADNELLNEMPFNEGKSLPEIAVEYREVHVLIYLRRKGYKIFQESEGQLPLLILSIHCRQANVMCYLVSMGVRLNPTVLKREGKIQIYIEYATT